MPVGRKNHLVLFLVILFALGIFIAIFVTSKVIISDYETQMYNTFAFLKEEGVQSRKIIAKDRVHSIVQYLDAEHKMTDNTIKEKIKNSVDTAHALLSAYYDRNKEHLSKKEMKASMLGILRAMRWDGGRGYYFIINLNGIEEMNPLNYELEGVDIGDLKDSQGKPFVKEILDKARDEGHGFVEYVWTTEQKIDALNDRKITYLRKFEPFDWVLCTGEYPFAYEAEVQRNVLEKLQAIRFENNENNYLFVYDLHDMNGGDTFATMLINPNRPDLVGKKISDNAQNSHGKKYRKEMLQLVRNSQEGFVEYAYQAPQSKTLEQKISYFIYYPQWHWIVASGVFLGDIEKEYEQNIMSLSITVDQKIKTFQILFGVLGALLILFAYGVLQIQKQRMEKSSQEIENLNTKLQERVEEEVNARVVLEEDKNMKEKLLIQHAKMAEMGEMIGIITHQWKQPLNSISLLSQDILQMQKFGELTDESITRTTEGIAQQLGFMVHTIDDFRDFFKPDKEKSCFGVVDAIQSVLKIFAIQIKVYDIVVTLQNNTSDDSVYGFENEFKQVILNILNNAKDIFLETRRIDNCVSIELCNKEALIVINMSDNARGIDVSLLPDKIFESYVSTKGEKGTGIGLSMSKMIIEKRFGGTIRAFNNDEGAEFEITLPLQKEFMR